MVQSVRFNSGGLEGAVPLCVLREANFEVQAGCSGPEAAATALRRRWRTESSSVWSSPLPEIESTRCPGEFGLASLWSLFRQRPFFFWGGGGLQVMS